MLHPNNSQCFPLTSLSVFCCWFVGMNLVDAWIVFVVGFGQWEQSGHVKWAWECRSQLLEYPDSKLSMLSWSFVHVWPNGHSCEHTFNKKRLSKWEWEWDPAYRRDTNDLVILYVDSCLAWLFVTFRDFSWRFVTFRDVSWRFVTFRDITGHSWTFRDITRR